MARLSNKTLVLIFLLLGMNIGFAQQDVEEPFHDTKDYKDPKQFEKFRKRRIVIAAWQVNQLKTGALVVRLKTNQKVIDGLRKQGKESLAQQKEMEQFAIDQNTMYSYKKSFNFCKVYFIYSNSSDTLLKGARSGIFLDDNLIVDPNIIMQEKFYLLAERDYAYNSSIGFVKEDSARYVSEGGNPVKEMAIVIKNKYGHQLKGPFPYFVKDKTYAGTNAGIEQQIMFKGQAKIVLIGKQFSREKLMSYIEILNDNLKQFHQSSPPPDLSRVDPVILPLLY
jgi:hypothetical protein